MEQALRGDGAEGQFFLLNVVGNSRSFATFDQIGDSITDALGVAEKFDIELIVFVASHDGDFDGWRRLFFQVRMYLNGFSLYPI